jgi:hypothetical protein
MASAKLSKILAEDLADSCRELARRERAGIVSLAELAGFSGSRNCPAA